jgi:hypothetical protein
MKDVVRAWAACCMPGFVARCVTASSLQSSSFDGSLEHEGECGGRREPLPRSAARFGRAASAGGASDGFSTLLPNPAAFNVRPTNTA